MDRLLFAIGALSALIAVAAGAFGAPDLRLREAVADSTRSICNPSCG